MQPSIIFKRPLLVALRLQLRTRAHSSIVAQTRRRPLSCCGRRHFSSQLAPLRPEYNDNPRSSLRNKNNTVSHDISLWLSRQQSYRIHSTLSSTSFWRGLHAAVRQGNGSQAEEIAEQVLTDYYRLISSPTHDSEDGRYICQDGNGIIVTQDEWNDNLPLLDSQIFSLVLQAWKNSECATLHSALRAHNLLLQMAALADQDVLCDPPLLEDYLTVLECWHLASSLEKDDQYNKSSNNNNISLVLKHVEELWIQMKERQRREMMMNDTQHFVINERAYELVASLLAKAGQAVPAEQVVEEAIAQEQLRRSGQRYNYPVSPESSNATNNSKENHQGEEPSPQIGLNLCHAVLQAHLRSKETKAPQRAEAFLQKMRTDSSLPIPDVNSYNLVLERWIMASKATTNKDAMISIAKRIEDLIHQMKETDRIQPNLISYQYGIDALARSGNPIRSETMLANLVKDYFLQYDADLKPSIAPFQSVLWAYSKAASEGPVKQRLEDAANRAEGILNDMIELSTLLDTYPTVWSYNIVMKCWAHSKSNDASARTSALYEQLLQLPPADDNISGEKRVDTNQDDEEDPFRNRPSDLGPDRTSMNTLLKVLSKNEGAARAEEKLWEFYDDHIRDPKRNPSPDTIAFSTTIHAWSKTSHLDSAERADALLRKLIELYDNGKKKAHKPDIVTYTNVMQCWTKSKQPGAPEKVESILREVQRMERDGDTSMKPDAACWNTAISAWAAEGNGENAERLFFEMVDNANTSNGASPTPITLTNVLKAWTNCMSPEAPERATKLLAGMEELYEHGTLKVKPNVVNYTVVLDCLAYAHTSSAAEIAENMLKDMVSSEDPNLRPNVVSYNSVIKAWSHAKDPESASKITILLRDLIEQSEKDSKLKPTENTFGTILKFLADSDLPDKAERAMSIQNLMGIFLDDRKPVQPWVEKELRRCMSDA